MYLFSKYPCFQVIFSYTTSNHPFLKAKHTKAWDLTVAKSWAVLRVVLLHFFIVCEVFLSLNNKSTRKFCQPIFIVNPRILKLGCLRLDIWHKQRIVVGIVRDIAKKRTTICLIGSLLDSEKWAMLSILLWFARHVNFSYSRHLLTIARRGVLSMINSLPISSTTRETPS